MVRPPVRPDRESIGTDADVLTGPGACGNGADRAAGRQSRNSACTRPLRLRAASAAARDLAVGAPQLCGPHADGSVLGSALCRRQLAGRQADRGRARSMRSRTRSTTCSTSSAARMSAVHPRSRHRRVVVAGSRLVAQAWQPTKLETQRARDVSRALLFIWIVRPVELNRVDHPPQISQPIRAGRGRRMPSAGVLATPCRRAAPPAMPNLDPNTLAQFVDPLPLPRSPGPWRGAAPGEVRRARAVLSRRDARHYRASCIAICRRPICGPTAARCRASRFETRSGQGHASNGSMNCRAKHFLPIDHTLHGAEAGKPEVRGVVHLHGGKTPPESDGYPEDWYVPGQSRTYYYPERAGSGAALVSRPCDGYQPAEYLCRLVRTACDSRRARSDALQLPSGKYEVPLVLFDRDLRRMAN